MGGEALAGKFMSQMISIRIIWCGGMIPPRCAVLVDKPVRLLRPLVPRVFILPIFTMEQRHGLARTTSFGTDLFRRPVQRVTGLAGTCHPGDPLVSKPLFLACTCISAILLSACSSDGGGSAKDRQSELDAAITAASAGSGSAATSSSSGAAEPSPEQQSFLENGFLDQDVASMASRMGGDIPNSPRLVRQGSERSSILVDQQYIDVQGEASLNKNVFAQRLLRELQQLNTSNITYVDRRAASSSNNLGNSSSKSGKSGGGSSSTHSSRPSAGQGGAANYRLECTVTAMPATAEHARIQRYAFQVVDNRTHAPIWMGDFDIDAPLKPSETPQAK